MKLLIKPFTLLFLFALSPGVDAGVEVQKFENVQQQQQYKKLIDELRCLVCQNQNLADSDAELAQDLRKKVAAMIEKGQSEKEIIDYMVARYGDFVLYRPPLDQRTFMLWFGPFLILLMGLVILVVYIKRQKKNKLPALSDEQQARVKKLLDQEDGE